MINGSVAPNWPRDPRDRIEAINRRLDQMIFRLRIFGRTEGELTLVLSVAFSVAIVALAFFVIDSHANGYRVAGVPDGQAAVGAIAAQVSVAATMITAGALIRAQRARAATITAVLGGGLLLLFALLPNIVAGSTWVTALLAVVSALLLHAAAGVYLGIAALLVSSPRPSGSSDARRTS